MTKIKIKALILCSCLRLLLIVSSSIYRLECFRYVESEAVSSALRNPLYSLSTLREGKFLLDVYDGNYASVYREENGAFFNLPPLVLAAFEPLFSWIKSPVYQDFFFSLVMMLVDLSLSLGLYRLAKNVLFMNDEDASREERLEQKIVSAIRPSNAWVFGIRFPETELVVQNGVNDLDVKKDESTNEDSNNDICQGIKNSVGHSSSVDEACKENSFRAGTQSEVPNNKTSLSNEIPDDIVAEKKRVVSISDLPEMICILFYCNPLSILASCRGLASFQNLLYLFLVMALLEASKVRSLRNSDGHQNSAAKDHKKGYGNGPNISKATFYLALLSYIEIYYFVCLIPISLFVEKFFRGKKSRHSIIGLFVFWSFLLQVMSTILVGNSNASALIQIYVRYHSFVELSPNLGMHWYFFSAIFSRFRHFFVVMLVGLPYTLVTPLYLRLHLYPIDMVIVFNFVWNCFKPTSTLQDLVFLLTSLLLSPRSLARMSKVFIVAFLALPVPITLFIAFHWLWLETGSGNANYIFFQCLAYNIFLVAILSTFAKSIMERDKALRLTEKESLKISRLTIKELLK